MDTIRIKDLRLHGHHGVLPEENRLGQHFLVSLELETDLQPAGSADDMDRGIDYRRVIAAVREVMEGPPLKLLEALAERIAGSLLERFPEVSAVTVETGRPVPPIPEGCGGIYVKIRRSRS